MRTNLRVQPIVEQVLAGIVIASVVGIFALVRGRLAGIPFQVTTERIIDVLRSPVSIPFWLFAIGLLTLWPIVLWAIRSRSLTREKTARRGSELTNDELAIMDLFAKTDRTELPIQGFDEAIALLERRDFVYVSRGYMEAKINLQPEGRTWLLAEQHSP